jgi:hypothetical protein
MMIACRLTYVLPTDFLKRPNFRRFSDLIDEFAHQLFALDYHSSYSEYDHLRDMYLSPIYIKDIQQVFFLDTAINLKIFKKQLLLYSQTLLN